MLATPALLIAKRRKEAGAKAATCEKRSLVFVPLAVASGLETLGGWDQQALDRLKLIAHAML